MTKIEMVNLGYLVAGFVCGVLANRWVHRRALLRAHAEYSGRLEMLKQWRGRF